MEEIKKEAVYLEDGRKADKIVQEKAGAVEGETQVVTEVWAEPKIEKKLTQRVVEHKKPVVHRREIEVVDQNTGEVVEKKIESIEPEVKMQLREHIQTENQVAALSVNDCNCYVTQEDMQKTFADGFVTIAKILKEKDEPVYEEGRTVSAMQVVVGDKIEAEAAKPEKTGMILWGTIAALSALFVYVVFLM
jgi:folylpolyglutamate synthase/dihydropteroate synthase